MNSTPKSKGYDMPRNVLPIVPNRNKGDDQAIEAAAKAWEKPAVAPDRAAANAVTPTEIEEPAPTKKRERRPRASSKPEQTPAAGPGIVQREGRMHADGVRRGARTLRRMTVYLRPDLASELRQRSFESNESLSDLIEHAVEQYLR